MKQFIKEVSEVPIGENLKLRERGHKNLKSKYSIFKSLD